MRRSFADGEELGIGQERGENDDREDEGKTHDLASNSGERGRSRGINARGRGLFSCEMAKICQRPEIFLGLD
jgi:hypothetical protein